MPRIEPSHGCFAAFSRVVGTALLVVEFLGRACCLGFRSSALLGPRLRLGPRRPGDAGRRRGDPRRTHVELVPGLGLDAFPHVVSVSHHAIFPARFLATFLEGNSGAWALVGPGATRGRCLQKKIFNPSVPKDFLDMFCHLDFLWSFFDCLVIFFFAGEVGWCAM